MVLENLSIEEVVERGQSPPPEWHAGRQAGERPARHPDSPANRKTRGSEERESAKANPLLGIAEKCPERCAKDLDRHDPQLPKQTHFEHRGNIE